MVGRDDLPLSSCQLPAILLFGYETYTLRVLVEKKDFEDGEGGRGRIPL